MVKTSKCQNLKLVQVGRCTEWISVNLTGKIFVLSNKINILI